MPDWFAVDRAGLAALLERRGKGFVLLELIQNAWDEKTSTVSISLTPIPGRPAARLIVEDDSPEGFADLTHAFTLFAPSTKLAQAEKRGRFNLGEKLVLSLCLWAEIISTKGGYRFDDEGRHTLRRNRDAGSLFTAEVRMTRQEVDDALSLVRSVIPPSDVATYLNGAELPHRSPVHTFEATLASELDDGEGRLRPTKRRTRVAVHEPAQGETPMIYEMGIPVVESGDRWSVDIGQKVPLNMDRDNVTPAFLRHVRTLVLNEMHAKLTDEEATGTWVKEAIADPRVGPKAVVDVVAKLYGEDAVVFDPSDPEANRIATAQGRTVIPPRAFSREAWDNIRSTGVVLPAGRVTPSPKILSSPDGVPPVPEAEWSDGMRRVAAYTRRFSKAVLGFEVAVEYALMGRMDNGGDALAFYGSRTLTYNLRRLGRRLFDEPIDHANLLRLDAIIIHELGHEIASNHLDERYYHALCDLGAKAKAHAREIGTP
jgi:hypothetical protein